MLTLEINKNKEFVDSFTSVKSKLDGQIREIVKQICEIGERGPSLAEITLKSQIESYKQRTLDVRSHIVAIDIETDEIGRKTADVEEKIAQRSSDITLYMKSISELESTKEAQTEKLEKLREQIRSLKKNVDRSDPVYEEISEVIDANKKYKIELIERYNQTKDNLRIAFQTAKVCSNDKLKSIDVQITTLRKLITDQLAKRSQKEAILEKVTKQPDFDWKRLTEIIDVKKRIGATKASVMNIKSGNSKLTNEVLLESIEDFAARKKKLQESIAVLKRSAAVFESEHRITYDVKNYDFEAKIKNLRELVQKRKDNIAQLEGITQAIANNSVLINPEKTTLEAKFEATFKRQLEHQSKEIADLKNVLIEYSSD